MLQLPDRLFYTLADLERRWLTGASNINHWLIYGDLLGAAWLPVMSVVTATADSRPDGGISDLRHWQGFIRLSGHQCRRLFRNGRITLRQFIAFDGQREFELPEPSDDIILDASELVILEEERKRFEARYPGVCPPTGDDSISKAEYKTSQTTGQCIDPTYRSVQVDGRTYHFGEIQAKVIGLLAEAARQGRPWQNGKMLLLKAGSQSYSLSNVFKRHPAWRKLIQSDHRGFYRLNETFW